MGLPGWPRSSEVVMPPLYEGGSCRGTHRVPGVWHATSRAPEQDESSAGSRRGRGRSS
ncbi:hypothetical protein LI90_3440 [Carbonactinospora thermoautotrophica]|uniref:Uncharacterized protein n=1 Tax=Carbonactinospora thermoautotrophica TaxID=1469144 RepID=A0A132MX45_9ACTN|nr:hypothetical protein LI90_3440 [Carbonactinospora thermoautotrophica]